MLQTLRSPRPVIAASRALRAPNRINAGPHGRAASTSNGPLGVSHLKVQRNWRDSLDIAPLAATFAKAANRAYNSGNGELVCIKLPKNNRNLRHNLDAFMAKMQDAAATDLDLELTWQPASDDLKATERQALFVPKR